MQSSLVKKNATTVQLTTGNTTLYIGGKYLSISRSNLSTNTSQTTNNCNLSLDNSSIKVRNTSHTYYYFSNNGSWTTTNSSTNLTLYKIESREAIREKSPATPKSYNREISVDVDLQLAKEGDSGLYYVYLLIDYDQNLIDLYRQHNEISFTIGQQGEPFEDFFEITPVKIE